MSDFDVPAFHEFEAAGWNDVAAAYSASEVVTGLTGGVASALAAAASAAPDRRILDVACGPGAASEAAAERGADVVGIDISEAMVEEAARKVTGARFRQASAEELPFEEGSFDGVTAVVEHGSLDVPIPDGPDMFRFAVEAEAIDTLESIGFADVEVAELPLTVVLREPSQVMEIVTSATVRTRALFEAQTPEAKEAIASAVADAVEQMRDGDQLSVPMPAVLISASLP